MNIDGNRIQILLKRWRYKGYSLISMNISEIGYEVIAAANNLTGVKTTGNNLDEAIQYLEHEIDKIAESEYKVMVSRIREELLTEVA